MLLENTVCVISPEQSHEGVGGLDSLLIFILSIRTITGHAHTVWLPLFNHNIMKWELLYIALLSNVTNLFFNIYMHFQLIFMIHCFCKSDFGVISLLHMNHHHNSLPISFTIIWYHVINRSHSYWQIEKNRKIYIWPNQTIYMSIIDSVLLVLYYSLFVLNLNKLKRLKLRAPNEYNWSCNPFASVSKTQTYSKLKTRTATGLQIPTSFTA